MPFVITITLLVAVALTAALFFAWWLMIRMPGKSFRGTPPALEAQQTVLARTLEEDLTVLAHDIGERNVSHRYEKLVEAAEFIERTLQATGYQPRRQEISVNGKVVWNVDVERTGQRLPKEVVVVGAHYDTVPGSPGANDNGSAVVATLALARIFAQVSAARTIRFVFFVNEESPYYMTDAMGSLRYAQECQTKGENVLGMISLETIGCYFSEPMSQGYPIELLKRFYPTTGDFVAVVGNLRSRRFVHQVIRGFRRTQFPSEGLAAPRWLKDIFRSDHAAFWYCGYSGVMITDTANFRYRYYHTPEDTVDKIDFTALARVVTGVDGSLRELLG
ncbi:MAG: M28 family peptidase [Nitrospirota bacterium]|nr:M28 family peptidase [Nitrospirota bacterium]